MSVTLMRNLTLAAWLCRQLPLRCDLLPILAFHQHGVTIPLPPRPGGAETVQLPERRCAPPLGSLLLPPAPGLLPHTNSPCMPTDCSAQRVRCGFMRRGLRRADSMGRTARPPRAHNPAKPRGHDKALPHLRDAPRQVRPQGLRGDTPICYQPPGLRYGHSYVQPIWIPSAASCPSTTGSTHSPHPLTPPVGGTFDERVRCSAGCCAGAGSQPGGPHAAGETVEARARPREAVADREAPDARGPLPVLPSPNAFPGRS